MPKVTFQPLNQTVEGQMGESILDIAIQNNIPIQHACGGFCACTTCHVIVKSGAENISAVDEDEEERLDRAIGITLHSRLACQSKLKGDVVVEIVNLE